MKPAKVFACFGTWIFCFSGAALPAPAQQPRAVTREIGLPLAMQSARPVVEAAAIQILARPIARRNAALVVTFSTTVDSALRRPPAQRQVVRITLDGQVLELRDDGTAGDQRAGDGRFTALLTVNPDTLRVQQALAARAARTGRRPALFREREFLGPVTVDTSLGDTRNLDSVLISLRRAALDRRLLVRRDLAIRPGSIIPIVAISIVDPATVDVPRSLTINHPGVITDPTRTFTPCGAVGNANGVWSFKHAMAGLANTPATGIGLSHFTRRWLRRWVVDQVVNDAPSLKRSGIEGFLNRWLAASGGIDLDLDHAPFRLLAIVNRTDLRDNLTYGGGSAGEGRLVFGAVEPSNPCSPTGLLFTVIFEYGISKASCSASKAWGQQWFDLRNHPIGSSAYNTALEAITEQFVATNTDPTQFPNRSALNQLRTNEFLNSPWQLREFKLAPDDADVGHLRQVTVKQNPIDNLNRQQVIADYVNANAGLILVDRHVVPAEFPIPPGPPFLGAESMAGFNDFWDGPGLNPSAAITTPDTRHRFSFNTCDACHTGETATLFTHIKPEVNPGAAGSLSAFMAGLVTVTDPAGEQVGGGAPKTRTFHEPLRRQQSLADLLGQSCLSQIHFRPLRMVH